MKIRIGLVFLFSLGIPALSAEQDVSAAYGLSGRDGSKALSVLAEWQVLDRWALGGEVLYEDQGRQSDGIKNDNRPLSLNGTLRWSAGESFSILANLGLTGNGFGHNGSGNNFHAGHGFSGWNTGIGAEWRVARNLGLEARILRMDQPQTDRPEGEIFTFSYVGARWHF